MELQGIGREIRTIVEVKVVLAQAAMVGNVRRFEVIGEAYWLQEWPLLSHAPPLVVGAAGKVFRSMVLNSFDPRAAGVLRTRAQRHRGRFYAKEWRQKQQFFFASIFDLEELEINEKVKLFVVVVLVVEYA